MNSVISLTAFFLWAGFLKVLLQAFQVSNRLQKYFFGIFGGISLLSYAWTKYQPSPYLHWFGHLPDKSTVEFSWWPKAFWSLPHFPGELWLFLFLLVSGGVFLWRSSHRRLFLLFWILILFQTFLHLSLHSPYTYLPHFEQTAQSNHWYHANLFPNDLGAVNEDYYWFLQSEILFLGSDGILSIFWNRLLPHFLSSRISSFCHPLYAWIILNTVAWFFSILAVRYVARVFAGERVSHYAALLQVSSPALITYVGQAKPYVMAFSLIAVLVALFVRLFIEKEASSNLKISFGLALGVFLLCYELQPWLIVFFLWALFLKRDWKLNIGFTLIALFIYKGFEVFISQFERIKLHETLQPGYGDPLQNVLSLITSFDLGRMWGTLHYSVKSAWVLSFHAFSPVLPLAIGGGILAWRQSKSKRHLFFLLLPGLVACLLVGFTGQNYYFHYGRIVFGNYVGMYLLAAWALNFLSERFSPKLAFLFIFLNTLYWNLDVWGIPAIYFHWFYRYPAHAHTNPLPF